MKKDIVFVSDKIIITKKKKELFIESFRKGMSMDEFNILLKNHPEIKINNFLVIKNALLEAPKCVEKFGELRERISVEVSEDELKAMIVLSVLPEELEKENLEELYSEIIMRLKDKGVIYGIKQEKVLTNIRNGIKIIAAEGLAPVAGDDSKLIKYKIHEIKPKISEEDKADFYDLDLINRVNKGDWLGERIDATLGKPGRSVYGKIIEAKKGKTLPFLYDRKTVEEKRIDNKIVLYAKQIGAVHYEGDRIGVSNHLEIVNNVDFKTGNVDFDGFITVNGSVEDCFSVVATKDIEVLGEYGVGSVKEIISKDGNIYIKGGVAGKNKAIIRSEKNIYTKFISEAKIITKGCLNVGKYCINSDIEAREVVVESFKGSIIGGNVKAKIKVISPTIGSSSEIKTFINVLGFERDNLKHSLEKVLADIEDTKNEMITIKSELISYQEDFKDEDMEKYQDISDKYVDICEKLKKMSEERNIIIDCLRTMGEGEIKILNRMFPNVYLKIREKFLENVEQTIAMSYYVLKGEWKQK
ncbi:MAG: FapA family protein [Clostridiales bacterium]